MESTQQLHKTLKLSRENAPTIKTYNSFEVLEQIIAKGDHQTPGRTAGASTCHHLLGLGTYCEASDVTGRTIGS